MVRQRFLHHYLPAHLASTLVAGALVEFIFNLDPKTLSDDPPSPGKQPTVSVRTRFITAKERLGFTSMLAAWAATGLVLSVTIWGFWFFAPLTYGTPGLNVEQVLARKWLGYDLHFAK